jgi:phospholipid/cholesterol/gamma-HCH transport system substrate-binding protein
MENKAHALAAGIFVLVVASLLGLLAFWLSTDTGKPHRYEISTRESVSGLQPQAPVRYRGVEVGKVTAIGFDTQAPGHVLLQLDIDEKAPLTQSTFATLDFQGVTGLASVQLDDSGQASPALAPNDAKPPRLPLRQGLLTKLAVKGESLIDKSEQVATQLTALLSDANQKRLSSALDNIGQAAGSVQQTAVSADRLVNRLDATVVQRLDPALARLPALAADASKALQAVQTGGELAGQSAIEVSKTMRRFSEAGGTLDDIRDSTQAVSNSADSFNLLTVPRMNRALDETARSARSVGRAVGGISDNPQAFIFGNGPLPPGPGESGFVPPGARP